MKIEVEAKLILQISAPMIGEKADDVVLAAEQFINNLHSFDMTEPHRAVGVRIHVNSFKTVPNIERDDVDDTMNTDKDAKDQIRSDGQYSPNLFGNLLFDNEEIKKEATRIASDKVIKKLDKALNAPGRWRRKIIKQIFPEIIDVADALKETYWR